MKIFRHSPAALHTALKVTAIVKQQKCKEIRPTSCYNTIHVYHVFKQGHRVFQASFFFIKCFLKNQNSDLVKLDFDNRFAVSRDGPVGRIFCERWENLNC